MNIYYRIVPQCIVSHIAYLLYCLW